MTYRSILRACVCVCVCVCVQACYRIKSTNVADSHGDSFYADTGTVQYHIKLCSDNCIKVNADFKINNQ